MDPKVKVTFLGVKVVLQQSVQMHDELHLLPCLKQGQYFIEHWDF